MTEIKIDEIKITSLDFLMIHINGIEQHYGLAETSELLRNITEKSITIISRNYHKHNDYESFRNNFMYKLDRLLHNANYNRFPSKQENSKEYKFDYPYWLIESIQEVPMNKDGSTKIIKVTIRNILNEKLEDN